MDDELRKSALALAQKTRIALFTTNQILVKASQKKSCCLAGAIGGHGEFRNREGSLAWGARSVVIRAISDSATEDLPINFNLTLSENNEMSLTKVISSCAKSPGPALADPLRASQSQRAAAPLAAFLEGYLQELSHRSAAQISNRRCRGMSGAGTVVEQVRTLGPIPKTMRAGVYRDKGVVRVEEVPVPEVGDGEVLIKVAACGICGTDIKKIFYRYVEPPQILGHELAGTVVAIGRGVTKWRLGDRVMSFHHIPCGKCFFCERRMFSQCKLYKSTGLTAGLHAQWRRLWRIRESHALGGGAGNRGLAG